MHLFEKFDKTEDALILKLYIPIVELIYQASEDVNLWPQLLTSFAEALHHDHNEPSQARDHVSTFFAQHFSRALKISSNLTQLQHHDRLLDEILGHSPVGICYLKANGNLIYANVMAHQIFNQAPFTVCENKLKIGGKTFAAPDKEKKLKQPVKVTLLDDKRYTLYQLKIEGSEKQEIYGIIIVDNQAEQSIDGSTQKLYNLTATEQKIAEQLVQGHTGEAIAKTMERSPNTIKHHIKRIYSKVSVQKRTQLVQKLLTASHIWPLPRQSKAALETPTHTRFFYHQHYRVAYQSFGPENGFPVVWMHGYLGNILELPANLDILNALNIRLLVPERPGYGYSDFYSHHDFGSWSKVITAWLDELEIDHFKLIGNSSGAPFALQLALDLSTRVSALSLLSTFPNVITLENVNSKSSGTRTLLKVFTLLPSITQPLITTMLLNSVEYFVNNVLLTGTPPFRAPDKDRKWFGQPERKGRYIEQIHRCKRQGANGLSREFQLISQPWPFDISKIRCPVQIWHGDDDIISTMETYYYLKEHLPKAQCQLLEGETHALFHRHFEEILSDMAKANHFNQTECQ